MALSETSVIPKLSPRLIKNIYKSAERWSSFLITNSQKSARQPHQGVGTCTAVYPLSHPNAPPTPDHISSPSGILPFSWWKRLPGSCANELPLLLNDVCKLWPSLLPVHGVEPETFIRSPQPMRTATRGVQLDLGGKFEDFIHSSLAQPCGRKANIWPLSPRWAHFYRLFPF